MISMIVKKLMESLITWMMAWLKVVDDFADSSNQVFNRFKPFQYLLFDLIVLILVVKATKFIQNKCRPLKVPKKNEDFVRNIDLMFAEVKDSFNLTRPKGFNLNSDEKINFRLIEGLATKVKQVQDMHSNFQAEVIDSHIKILKIINQCEDKNYLLPPEKELVEPDSALPPLDEDHIEMDLI